MTDIQLSTVGDRIEEQLNTGRDIISVPGDVGFHQLSINPLMRSYWKQRNSVFLIYVDFTGFTQIRYLPDNLLITRLLK